MLIRGICVILHLVSNQKKWRITKEKEIIWDAVIITDSIECLSFIYNYVLQKINETHDEKFRIKLLEILKQIEVKINELKVINNKIHKNQVKWNIWKQSWVR